MTIQAKEVVVLGAGFTRAVAPNAPLMVDDYYSDILKIETGDYT